MIRDVDLWWWYSGSTSSASVLLTSSPFSIFAILLISGIVLGIRVCRRFALLFEEVASFASSPPAR